MGGWPRSTTARFAALTFIALTLSSVLLIGFIGQVTARQLDSDAQAFVRAERTAILGAFKLGGLNAARAMIANELRVPGPLVMLLADGTGKKLIGNTQDWPPTLATGRTWRRIDLYRAKSDRAEPFGVSTDALPDGNRLLVGRSLDEEARLRTTLYTILAGSVGLALALAAAVSTLLARFIGVRVAAVARVAAAVADGDLTQRVPAAGGDDAFERLGTALNGMLSRIEALLGEIRTVTDGLAHDLRSPVTRLKARIERAARGESVDLAAISAEADSLLEMLDTTLEISRAEAGIGRDNFTEIDLTALMHDLCEMYAPLAEERGVAMASQGSAPVMAHVHRELVGRAIANLVDNALRYGASGGVITLTAAAVGSEAVLTVADRGPGIAEADRAMALKRFGRLDAARGDGGAGLGLSLAASVARLHGGTLVLDDNAPGLAVILTLPLDTAGTARSIPPAAQLRP